MIPEAKKNAVKHALQITFGVSEFEEISVLTAGLSSALVFRIVVSGKPYLLRIITRTDAMSDPTHWYDCMRVTADADFAPHVWYTNIADRISITDFIEAKPFPTTEAAIILPGLLKRLHALPPFPSRINYFDAMDGFIQRFKAAKTLPEHFTNELFGQYANIAGVYPRKGHDFVSCHNDLKPENMLFDGNRVWLVDWEAAFLNDRYADLAVVANFVVMNNSEEKDYLKRYFGDEISEYHYARFFLMRQLLHIFYFTIFMSLGAAGGKLIDPDLTLPGFREFHDDIWAGKIDLVNNDIRQQYAIVHMRQALNNFKLERFNDALQIVSDH